MARTLGRFEVERFLARGGMGEVYVGRHVAEGVRAALKLVKPTARSHEALLREVRATASLNHPGIVRVYDYGEVNETESRASDGEFAVDSLWLALEFADSGTLESIEPPHDFALVRRIALDILDALGHAHARGLIHRDLKPANVLLTSRGDELALLLADFGIAHVTDPNATLPETTDTFAAPAAGTPRYMAPEQIRGDWRDQGPATDLYALACMLWELCTGTPAFAGDTSLAVAMAHMSEAVGRFEPLFECPPEFENWLRRLLRRERRERFVCAADAAAGLGGGSPARLSLQASATSHEGAETLPVPTTGANLTQVSPSGRLLRLRHADSRVPAPRRGPSPAGIALDWRGGEEALALGSRVGLALFGLREIPLIGREAERDTLWTSLRDVVDSGSERVVVVRGAEGNGKSKLLNWLATRAHELGAATVLRVSHLRNPGTLSGLRLALARFFSCANLSREETYLRLRDGLSRRADDRHEHRAAALTEILCGPSVDDDSVPPVRFDSLAEQFGVAIEALATEAIFRPVAVLIDDVQWGSDSLALVEQLLRTKPASAVLVVLAVDENTIGENLAAARRLEGLLKLPQVATVDLDALERPHQTALIRDHIGIAASLTESLLDAAAGDSNYALCVISDWVQRGVLRDESDGYVLPRLEELPVNLAEAWGARLDRVAARFSVPQRCSTALLLAATFGMAVDLDEWRSACDIASGSDPTTYVGVLLDAGIVRRTESGISFTHGAVVNVLLERARSAGRLAWAHGVCARAVDRHGDKSVHAVERQGMHRLAAGQLDEGLAHLRKAIQMRLDSSDYDRIVSLCTTYLAAAPVDEDALVIRARRADAMRYLRRVDEAAAEAHAILVASDEIRSSRGRGEGLRVLAGLEHGRGDAAGGIARYTAAIDAFLHANDRHGVAKALHGRGWFRLEQSDFGGAQRDFDESARLAQELGQALDVAWSEQGLAEASVYLSRFEPAAKAAASAMQTFERLGSRSGRGMATTSLGNVQRGRGDYVAARATYAVAIAELLGVQSRLVAFPLLHCVALELTAGDEASLSDALSRAHKHSAPRAFRVVAQLASLALTKTVGDFEASVAELRTLARDGTASHPLVWPALEVLGDRLRPDQLAQVNGALARLR